MKRMGVFSMACALAIAIGCNSNARTDNRTDTETVGTAGEADRTAVDDSDKDFVTKLLSDGTAEIELGKMASERAVNPDVKRYGQMMVDDHTKAGNELKQIAAQHSIAAAPALEEKHKDVMEKLSKLRGNEFDREFINAMVQNHEDAVDALETRVDNKGGLSDRAANPDSANAQPTPEKTDNTPKAAVNAWAAKTLPAVRHHLDEAKRLDDRLDSPQTTRR